MIPWEPITAVAAAAAAVATAALAVGTFRMATKTADAVAVARRAQELSIRPLLADPRPPDPGTPEDRVQFGAPGRALVSMPAGSFYWKREEGSFRLSVVFENVGAGVAVMQRASLEPRAGADLSMSRKLVPVGTTVRVSASILLGDGPGSFGTDWWAMGGVFVSVTYTDAAGTQPLVSRAEIRQYATHEPFVEKIAIFHAGESEPFVEGRVF